MPHFTKHEQMVLNFHADGLLGKSYEFPEGKLAKHMSWNGNIFQCDDIISFAKPSLS